MLFEDTEWHEDSGNEPISHDFVNRLELGVDMIAATGTTAVHPAPTGTTLPWGAGRMFLAMLDTGVVAGGDWTIDDSVDWNHRFGIVWGYAYDVAHVLWLPGEGTEPTSGPVADHYFSPLDAPSAPAPCMGYLKYGLGGGPGIKLHSDGGADVYLLVDINGHLVLHNGLAGTIYPCLMILASDQFPTRVP